MIKSTALATALSLTALPAAAIDVPSGQPVELWEVLVDMVEAETWLRFRFLAPQIARDGGGISFAQAEDDLAFLCNDVALPYMRDYTLDGDVIVISLLDRTVDFGASDPDATQFIDVFRPENGSCIWEGL